ncbi:MAG TPA: DUF5010 domain-containing protein [Mucilaginibacter sp.]|jgi:hypothetical protein|nr:DUF5010 domain-containing protein [Mucilaginibacter sp.]
MRRIKLLLPVLVLALIVGCSKKEITQEGATGAINADGKTTGALPAANPNYLGVTLCYNSAERAGGMQYPYNQSIFLSNTTEADWWDNMVEEVAYSGVDYIAPIDRGFLANYPTIDAGDPNKLANLCAAMDRRGLSNAFKVAIFDDIPASWTANRNKDNGSGYGYNPPFDCGNTANYKYIWDDNIKLCFQNVPDAKRFKLSNRPVIFFWSVNSPFCTNQSGNLKKIAQYIRTQCQSTFGFNPFLIVDQSWLNQDPTCNDPAVVDAVHNWFVPPSSYSFRTFNSVNAGVAVPSFQTAGNGSFLDPNHGQLLTTGLTNTVNAGTLVTLCEGFTDASETAAMWRSSDVTYYDYPNQRINILRRFTSKAYAPTLKVEAEGCDSFHDVTAGNSGGTFRAGDIDIVKTGDTGGGWHVTAFQAGEWLEWKELPLLAHTKFQLRYSSNQAASIKFSVDGVDLPTVTLPITGNGVYSTIDVGTQTFSANSLHTVRITSVSGSCAVNYFNRVSF